jgi:hypothetical protein
LYEIPDWYDMMFGGVVLGSEPSPCAGYQPSVHMHSSFPRDHRFSEGLSAIYSGGQWGYVDQTGKVVIKCQFALAGSFTEGLAPVRVGEKWGYIDKAGQIVIKPQYDSAYEFSGGIAEVSRGEKWGYIDRSGKYVWTPTE